MLMGLGCACLLAFGFAALPRVFLILAWIMNPERWNLVWSSWIWPVLGIIFLPYTTVMWMLSWTAPDGVTGWAWLWVILGVLLDVMHWGSIYERRQEIPYTSSYTGGAA